MNIRTLINDVERSAMVNSASHVKDLYRAYNIQMEEESDDDILVPIIEMTEDEDGTFFDDMNQITDDSIHDNLESEDHEEEGLSLNELLNSYQTENEKFSCDLCGAEFRIKHSITKHKRVVHGMHQFSCMFCNESYPLKRNLLEHIMSHKGPHGFKCNICNKVRPNYISIQRHVKTHAAKSIPCTKCEARFKTKWELRSHEIQHKVDREFRCEICGNSFINPSKLREHSLLHHSGDRPFRCDICSKDFSALGNLTNHRKQHIEGKPYKCQYCSLTFLSNSARKKHVPIHERERKKPFECADCNKKYTSTTSLAVHRLKFHSGDRVYHCHYCKQKFKSKTAVAEHVAEHAAERPHSCQHCLCRYKNKRELRRHQREKEHYDVEPHALENVLMRNFDVNCNDEWDIPEPEVCIHEESDDN